MLKIGVDGGGTTTRAALIEHNNQTIRVLARGEAGSSNHYSVGAEGAARHIESAIVAALQEANLAREQIGGYGFGLAGACTPTEQSLLREALSPLCGSAPFVVDEDAIASQAGAFGGEAGAICIAGTGANCFGVNDNGERARADGLGPLLGDRGGGYRIGEAALRAICSADDGSGPQTSLLAPCLRTLGADSIDHLVQIVYQPDFKRDRVAAVFPIVLQEADKGDAVAQNLLNDAARELAQTARAVLQKLGIARLAVVGGVLENAPPMREAFERELKKEIGEVEIIAPRYDAAVGAALLVN